MERRKTPRIKGSLPLKISSDESDFITQTENIGVNGALFRVEKVIPLMTRLSITLLVPPTEKGKRTKKILCQGVVVRCEPVKPKSIVGEHHVAVYFTAMKDTEKKTLAKYIDRYP